MTTAAIAPAPGGTGGDGCPVSVRLKDGTPAVLRLLGPRDSNDLRRGFERLSKRSRYLRFHAPIRKLSDAQLRYLTEPDQQNHIACCAQAGPGDQQIGVGVARCVRLPGQPEVAEFALTVADDFQNRGAGRALLGRLVQMARARGVRTLRCHVLRDNRSMQHILESFPCRYSYESPSLMTAEFDL